MNRQDKSPMVTREVVKPSLDNFRRHVEDEEKREDNEAHTRHDKNRPATTWFMGGKL